MFLCLFIIVYCRQTTVSYNARYSVVTRGILIPWTVPVFRTDNEGTIVKIVFNMS